MVAAAIRRFGHARLPVPDGAAARRRTTRRVPDRTLYDVYYVENWSLAMDLRVVLLTALRLVRDRQAN
jgi:lipopolysaccharide/colanic/teichoic acid biosynthesis glycosyltransferase